MSSSIKQTQVEKESGSNGSHNSGERNRQDETLVPVHENYVGAVIGKRGVTINKIKTDTNTRISHRKADYRLGHQSAVFAITGSPGNRRKAAKWVRNILQSTWDAEQGDESGDHSSHEQSVEVQVE